MHDFTSEQTCQQYNPQPTHHGGANQIRTGDKDFADLRLTTWLWRQLKQGSPRILAVHGAADEIRTRDIHLGKVALYH